MGAPFQLLDFYLFQVMSQLANCQLWQILTFWVFPFQWYQTCKYFVTWFWANRWRGSRYPYFSKSQMTELGRLWPLYFLTASSTDWLPLLPSRYAEPQTPVPACSFTLTRQADTQQFTATASGSSLGTLLCKNPGLLTCLQPCTRAPDRHKRCCCNMNTETQQLINVLGII